MFNFGVKELIVPQNRYVELLELTGMLMTLCSYSQQLVTLLSTGGSYSLLTCSTWRA